MFGEKPARGLPKPPPPHRVQIPRSLHVEKTRFQDADMESRCGIGTPRKRRGRKITQNLLTQQQNNISTPFFTRRYCRYSFSSPYCADLLLASLASKNRVLYSEGRVYKRTPELAASPQLTALHSTGNTSVKNSVTRTKSATATHVE